MKDPHTIIIQPLLTEKSVAGASHNKYTFRVDPDANKVEIRQAIEALFEGVRVGKVNTLHVRGKQRRINMPTGVKIVSSSSPIRYGINGSLVTSVTTPPATTVLEVFITGSTKERWTLSTNVMGVTTTTQQRVAS